MIRAIVHRAPELLAYDSAASLDNMLRPPQSWRPQRTSERACQVEPVTSDNGFANGGGLATRVRLYWIGLRA
jgi:hypothetical protein